MDEGKRTVLGVGHSGYPGSRSYRSTLRAARAAETRGRIITTARSLFATRGFARTTVALIAEYARVAEATVYAVCGSKGGIMRELLKHLETDFEGWWDSVGAEPNPHRKLELYAAWRCELFSKGRDVLEPALKASSDPVVLELREQGDRNAHQRLRPIIDALDAAGALVPGRTQQQTLERAWILTGSELYFRATDACGWSDEEYQRWLTELLHAQVLGVGGTRPGEAQEGPDERPSLGDELPEQQGPSN